MNMPSDEQIVAFHKERAPSERAFNVVYGHCQIIGDIALRLISAKQLQIDANFVHVAALLHDVGYYSLYDKTGQYVPKAQLITHGVVGAELLRKAGLPEAICRVAERHTGVGLTKEHILETHLPLPPRDFLAETPEERLLMYADKLHTKAVGVDEPRDVLGWFNSPRQYLAHARQFGEDNAAQFAAMVDLYGVPDLAELSQQYGQSIG